MNNLVDSNDRFVGSYWQWLKVQLSGWDALNWALFGFAVGIQGMSFALNQITWTSVVSFIATLFGSLCTVAMCAKGYDPITGKRVTSRSINGLLGAISVVGFVGKIEELREDEKGLYFRAKISNTTKGKDLAILIEDDAINEISIGYQAVVWEVDEVRSVRLLKEVKLYEVSFVTRAANEQAVVTTTEVKEEKPELTDDELLQKRAEIDAEIEKRAMDKFLKSI